MTTTHGVSSGQNLLGKTLILFSFILSTYYTASFAEHHKIQKKKWTVIIYMAAVNDLRGFAASNIKQMTHIGSNEHVNIVIHLDILLAGNRKVTRRYYVENGRVVQVNADDPALQQMDSGDPQTLISCCAWAIHTYPADHYLLDIWNHGSGPLDTPSRRDLTTNDLYVLNTTTNKLELDRSIGFIEYISQGEKRGVCWDDITGNYLTNQKLQMALKEVCATHLQGKKFDIIAFDACLMMMVEIADLVEPYAHLLVGSQEVELGTGWNYSYVLSQFAYGSPTPADFAHHIVAMYEKTYSDITHDFTQSAFDLRYLHELKLTLDYISRLLIACMDKQKDKSVKKAIKASRNRKITTVFDEPTYIDLHHWFTNLQASLKYFSLTSKSDETKLKEELDAAIEHGKQLIIAGVIANVVGKNLSKAKGLGIYFPEKNINPSYRLTSLMKENAWGQFLLQYLAN